jgi:uncharacterized membrane protein YphA (DoxX/SURF4 family)
MRPIFKWILGIVLGLLVIAAVTAMVFFGRGWAGHAELIGRHGMIGLRGSPLGGLAFISMGLIRLGGLILLILGVVWLVNRWGHHAKTLPAASPVLAEHKCSNCSKPVQADWKLCPYCGNNLAGETDISESKT